MPIHRISPQPVLLKPIFAKLFDDQLVEAVLLTKVWSKTYTQSQREWLESNHGNRPEPPFWFEASLSEICHDDLQSVVSLPRLQGAANHLIQLFYIDCTGTPHEPDKTHEWRFRRSEVESALEVKAHPAKFEWYNPSQSGNSDGKTDEGSSIVKHGYVYVMSNEALDYLKIGYTSKTPEKRRKSLSSKPALPAPFEVDFALECRRPVQVEESVHRELSDARVDESREFFDCSLGAAKEAITQKAQKWSASSDEEAGHE